MNFFFILCIVAALHLTCVQAKRLDKHRHGKRIKRTRKSIKQGYDQRGQITNGIFFRENYKWTFRCNKGYIRDGPDTIEFNLKSKKFTGPVSGCRPQDSYVKDHGYDLIITLTKVCYKPYVHVEKGEKLYSKYDEYKFIAACKLPRYSENLENGFYEEYSDEIITSVKYFCDQGYTLHGESEYSFPTFKYTSFEAEVKKYEALKERRCEISALWEGEIRGGHYKREGFVWNFTCNEGYILQGSETVKFDAKKKKWTHPIPACLEHYTIPIENGYYVDGKTGDMIVCNPPYFVDGDEKEPIRKFDYFDYISAEKEAKCQKARYTENFENGYYEYYQDDIITSFKYYCIKGYELKGKSEYSFPTFIDGSVPIDNEIETPRCVPKRF